MIRDNQLQPVRARILVLLLALFGLSWPIAVSAAASPDAIAAPDEPAIEEFPQPVEAERSAAEKVRDLGGWYELDAGRHVVEVNMVYHEDPSGRRQDNQQKTDEVLKQLPGFPRLKLLLLHGEQASDEGLIHVGLVRELEKLYIWNASGISDAGIAHLKGLNKLNYVHLSGSQVTDEAILHLSNLPLIEGLSMQQNAFTDKALEYAARMPNLRTLILDLGAKFTDEGMQQIRKMPVLEELWLQKTGITEEGLKALHGLQTLNKVVFNDDEFAAMGDTSIEELQKATPNLRVKRGLTVLPSINALSVADDPKQQEKVRREALDGLETIEQFLAFLEAKQDTKAAQLSSRRDVVTRMQGLRRQADYEPLKVSVANGNRDVVQALTTPAVIRESFDQQGNIRERRTAFVALKAIKKAGIWRVEMLNFQDEGSNTWMERFLAEYPDAQMLR